MDPINSGPVAVLFALPQEKGPFLRRHPSLAAGCLVACSGAGAAAARHAAEQLLQKKPRLLIVCGFAGAMGSLEPGQLIAAHTVVSASSRCRYTAPAQRVRQIECAASRLPQITLQTGTLATAERVLMNYQEKTALNDLPGMVRADAVDMETAAAAEAAQAQNTDWAALRAITDGLHDAMPLDFNSLADSNGQTPLAKVALAALRTPSAMPGLLTLGRRSALAARNLADCLSVFLEEEMRPV